MTALFDLTGKVAVVAGGGRGIGAAIALGLADAGADIAIAARTRSDIDTVAAAVTERGRRSVAIQLDVSKVDELEPAVDRVIDELGEIDILFNVAGINIRKPATELSEDDFDQVMDVNFKGAYFLSQQVGKRMIARGQGGKIVNIASLATGMGLPKITVYTGSKGALGQLTKGLAVEWAEHDIQVNALAPGFVATALNNHLWENEEFNTWILDRTPARRVGTPQDMVGTALFLAASASDFVTGQVIYVDGGIMAGSVWPL
jgi:gluconate 5-dehydrogenase